MAFGLRLFGWAATLDALDNLTNKVAGDNVWVVGTNVEYAIYVEFGTSKMSAQPYLRPAVNQTMQRADKIANRVSSTEELVAFLAWNVEAKAKQLAPVDTGNLRASIRAVKLR